MIRCWMATLLVTADVLLIVAAVPPARATAASLVGAEGRRGPDSARAASRCVKLGELISCYDALNLQPNNPDLLVAEADALVRLKRPGEAVGVYRNALHAGAAPRAVEVRIAAALALRRPLLDVCLSGEGPTALTACDSAWLPGSADEVAVHKRRGFLLQSANQPSAALDAYMAAARLRPGDREVARYIVSLCGRTDRKDAVALAALVTARQRLRRAGEPAAASPIAPVAPPPDPVTAGFDSTRSPSQFSNEAEITRSN